RFLLVHGWILAALALDGNAGPGDQGLQLLSCESGPVGSTSESAVAAARRLLEVGDPLGMSVTDARSYQYQLEDAGAGVAALQQDNQHEIDSIKRANAAARLREALEMANDRGRAGTDYNTNELTALT